jgi:hypothetical protein
MGAAVIIAAMKRREQEVIDDFRAANATAPERAQSYTALGVGDALAVRRLRNHAIIREAAPGTFYLDEEVWAAVRRTRLRILAVLIAIFGFLLIAMLLGIVKW